MKLPPMNSLKAFDAVSRHLSITKAASELFVSPGAVSQQIKILEEYLQRPVFVRDARALSLTRDGAEFAAVVQGAFTKIAQASETMARAGKQRRLTISVPPSFGVRWLIPNLGRFHDLHPDISIAIDARANLVDFAEDGVDAAVRYGNGIYKGLRADDLFGADMIIVASPEYLERYGPLTDLSGLAAHRLIHYLPSDPRYSGLHATWQDIGGMRTREGMAMARAKGRLRGKKPKLSEKQGKELRRMYDTGEYSISDLADVFSVSRPTIYRTLHRVPGREPLSQTERQSAAAKAAGKGSRNADQAWASRLLSDRLAAIVPFHPLSPRQGSLRALRAAAWGDRPPSRGRLLVRSKDQALAGWAEQGASHQSASAGPSTCRNLGLRHKRLSVLRPS